MATTTRLEDLYRITENSYTTGLESLDGLIIGLATLLLIRNGEFVVLDILTFVFGDRKHRIGFRVLRVWQMLNARHFFRLITGFDSDIPHSWLRRSNNEKRSSISKLSRCKIKKDKFATLLFVSVLIGKLLTLATEVAIIAFVIPVARVHTSDGGLGFQWKNATVTEASLSRMSTCQPLMTSDRLSDSAQLALCKRIDVRDSSNPLPQSWIEDGSLRMEEMFLTTKSAKLAGGFVTDKKQVFCEGQNDDDASSAVVRFHSPKMSRQVGFVDIPDAQFVNSILVGEIRITGNIALGEDGNYHSGSAAVLPVFSDARKTLRLAFSNFYAQGNLHIGGMGPTVNGKLLFGVVGSIPGEHSFAMCPQALDEIIRVTGTLHPGIIVDLFRSSIAVEARGNFSEPSPSLKFLSTVRGYEIGTSRKFRIQPEWMAVVAGVMVIISSVTSRLNKTEVRVARVYRENNNMWGSCSPAFLDGENVVDGGLFRKENEYHWGESPGEEWEELSTFEFSKDAILV